MHELAIEDGSTTGQIKVVNAEAAIDGATRSIKQLISEKVSARKLFYSIEVSPEPRAKVLNYRELSVRPIFTSITWLSDVNLQFTRIAEAPAFRLSELVRSSTAVLSHITCYKLTSDKLSDILANNVENVFALRGDFKSADQPMEYASDLVRSLRTANPDLSIGVAGYPEVHSEAASRLEDLAYLKVKVDAGADFIITQICFSFKALAKFLKVCRSLGINCPIIPGIFVPTTYTSLIKMCEICKVSIPEDQLALYQAVEEDVERFAEVASTKTCQLLDQIFNWDYEKIYGVHFFTLNKYEHVEAIVKKYDF